MAKQTFGGDDDEGAPVEEKKQKLRLDRFSGGPDMNVRELFWKIIGEYANGKAGSIDYPALESDRFAIARAAIGAMERPSPMHARMTQPRIARYSLMMLLDSGWQDCFVEFLDECMRRHREILIKAMQKLATEEGYQQKVAENLKAMLRYRENGETALKYLGGMDVPSLAQELKKELIILARGDIGENQQNAISALSCIMEDEEVRKTLVVLLSHWDESARYAAAEMLARSKTISEDVKAAAKRRLESESDPDIKKLLEKISR